MQSKTTGFVLFPILFGFFVMGFVDVVGIATNYVKQDFALSDTLANLLPMMVFLWFALFSIPAGIWMGRWGRRNTVLVAMGFTLVAMLMPLLAYRFDCLLIAFALLGIGNTILQVSLNPMVAAVVRPDRMTSVLTWGQFIKAISSFLGPILAAFTALYIGDWRWIFPVYALTTLLAMVWVVWSIPHDKQPEEQSSNFASTCSLCRNSVVRMLLIGIVCIVGIDVGLNTSIPKLLMERLAMPLAEAGLGSSLYFAARTAGSFLGAIVLARCASRLFLRVSMAIALVAFVALLLANSFAAIAVLIVCVGLACSNVFSIFFGFALAEVPTRQNEVSALMIMGVSGGALLTPLMGLVADQFGQVAAFGLLGVCLVYIGWIAIQIKTK